MTPLDLAMASSSLFSGVSGAVDGGTEAGKTGNMSALHSKEIVGGGLILATGIYLAWKERAWWPIVVAIGTVVLLVALHEHHAKQSAPSPDVSLSIVRFK